MAGSAATRLGLACFTLVERRAYPTVPPRVEYRLTELGLTLEGPLSAVRDWAETYINDVDAARIRYDDNS